MCGGKKHKSAKLFLRKKSETKNRIQAFAFHLHNITHIDTYEYSWFDLIWFEGYLFALFTWNWGRILFPIWNINFSYENSLGHENITIKLCHPKCWVNGTSILAQCSHHYTSDIEQCRTLDDEVILNDSRWQICTHTHLQIRIQYIIWLFLLSMRVEFATSDKDWITETQSIVRERNKKFIRPYLYIIIQPSMSLFCEMLMLFNWKFKCSNISYLNWWEDKEGTICRLESYIWYSKIEFIGTLVFELLIIVFDCCFSPNLLPLECSHVLWEAIFCCLESASEHRIQLYRAFMRIASWMNKFQFKNILHLIYPCLSVHLIIRTMFKILQNNKIVGKHGNTQKWLCMKIRILYIWRKNQIIKMYHDIAWIKRAAIITRQQKHQRRKKKEYKFIRYNPQLI